MVYDFVSLRPLRKTFASFAVKKGYNRDRGGNFYSEFPYLCITATSAFGYRKINKQFDCFSMHNNINI